MTFKNYYIVKTHKKTGKKLYNNFFMLKGSSLKFGNFGLKALNPGLIRDYQYEASYKSLVYQVKQHLVDPVKIWKRIKFNVSKTKKPLETRMGKGRGSINHWLSPTCAGTILYEIELPTDDLELAKKIFKTASHKLPVQTKVLFRTK